ncbi:hydroxymethylglutaryl-CoA lyase [Dyadobacter jejuensis]|uniref:Hydroxymethylglutaryl-CoA lyase n=1 Tax=Dyadobacter jejuensis TaxID=1082580 RepID=A0A316ASD9_9BACT|nr:hydroxymethylglutaryl-CoA lyase [Dyadobacter jejuensis]PWJ60256.1 hydroxymethylglutaryl-CoA lyase [Dyadobacter jejuensis]
MKLIECPRDAWQGLNAFIATKDKIDYLNRLLQVGFDTLDFGSFVSPKAMPQVSDTALVVEGLDLAKSNTRLLAIVANARGAAQACSIEKIHAIGYPFSISDTFQIRNTNASMEQSVVRLKEISTLCMEHGKELVVYISMGFGNPYGDPWSPTIVGEWVQKLSGFNIRTFSLSDTVGLAQPDAIAALFTELIGTYPEIEFGAHFHTKPEEWKPKVTAAYQAGCRRFDGALLGYGGCPMAQDDLVGNMPTERLIQFGQDEGELLNLDLDLLETCKAQFSTLMQGV